MEYTKLQAPRYLGNIIVDYTEENIENFYPSKTYTRVILWGNSIGSEYLCPGFYSMLAWEEEQAFRRAREENYKRRLDYEKTLKYKMSVILKRLHRAYDVLRGYDEEN